ncbi:hypothetical protein ACIBTZ_11515 [Micromonospora sp. NPDC049460]|uniref:hypothetical protein n=1 Tax=Micromonospora sp. NPDC049460 TaxID=3364272 RepID=UPI0037BD5CB2
MAIDNAMDQSSGDAAIRDVKTIIAREMTEIDSSLDVLATDHFNHSFFPDFVVSWRDNGVEERRDVFLRHDATSVLYQDVDRMEKGDEVFLGIRATQADPEARDELATALQGDSECLVSDAASLDSFAMRTTPVHSSSVLPSVAAKVWLRGARGLLDQPAAAKLQDQVAVGESAIIRGAVDDGEVVVSAVRRNFRAEYAKRIERVMQIMWLSGGNPLSAFPGRHAMSTRLSESEIRWLLPFLLRSAHVDDDFWRLVGEVIDLRLLQSLGDVGESTNLDRLITVNLDRLLVTQVMLHRRNVSLHPQLNNPHWSIRGGLLTLGAEGFDCQVVNDKRKLTNARHAPWPTYLDDLQPRLERYRLQEIAFSSPAATVDVKSATSHGLAGRQASDITGSLGAMGGIAKVAVRPAGASCDILINFLRGTAETDEGSQIQALVMAAIDLIYQGDAALIEQLKQFFEIADFIDE